MENAEQNSEKHEMDNRLDTAHEAVKGNDDYERFQENGGLNQEEKQEVNALEQDIKQSQMEREKDLEQGRESTRDMER